MCNGAVDELSIAKTPWKSLEHGKIVCSTCKTTKKLRKLQEMARSKVLWLACVYQSTKGQLLCAVCKIEITPESLDLRTARLAARGKAIECAACIAPPGKQSNVHSTSTEFQSCSN